ncbi:MAG: lipoyl(octanoyl) transferase LipB [Rhodothermales bacterium]|nr:lipoyl(octanoyl) transferase LipB [Rhodothermales bacterium]
MERVERSPNRHVAVCHLGRAPYRPTWDLQREIQDRLIQAKRENPQHGEDHVLLTVEHPPVYTLGKSGDRENLLIGDAELDSQGATFVEIDRGGDITFHGPGQLVVYPILDLDQFFTDIHRYLRTLEEAVISTCATFSIDAGRSQGRTGVWVGPDVRGPERKICAMGIKCSRWVTSHGLALNVSTDLRYFDNIVPCGITDRGVTSLSIETGRQVSMDDVIPVLVSNVVSAFGMSASEYAGHAAIKYLQARFGISVPPEAVFGEDEQKRSPDELSLFDDSRQ